MLYCIILCRESGGPSAQMLQPTRSGSPGARGSLCTQPSREAHARLRRVLSGGVLFRTSAIAMVVNKFHRDF